MKNFRKIFTLLFSLSLVLVLHAQKYRDLSVGDEVPDVEIKRIVNYSASSAKLSDFRGKLLILDFWGTWCAPCIGAIPKIDSLQKKFGDRIQILPVTQEDEKQVYDFLEKIHSKKNIRLPSVTNDVVLKRLFTHSEVPHYVWIDGAGKVIAITGGEDVTESNVAKALNGQANNFRVKKDYFDVLKHPGTRLITAPTLSKKKSDRVELEVIPDSNVFIYSVLSKYVDGVLSGMSFDSGQISIRNRPILALYSVALNGDGIRMINFSSTRVDIKDSALYERVTGQKWKTNKGVVKSGLEATNWLKEFGFCYELKVNSLLAEKRFDIMLAELNRYFGLLYGIEGGREKIMSPYLALVQTGTSIKLASSGSKGELKFGKYQLTMKNRTTAILAQTLAIGLQAQPLIIDETNIKQPVDIELRCQMSDLNEVNKELAKYNLQLVVKEKLMEVGYIREKSRQ